MKETKVLLSSVNTSLASLLPVSPLCKTPVIGTSLYVNPVQPAARSSAQQLCVRRQTSYNKSALGPNRRGGGATVKKEEEKKYMHSLYLVLSRYKGVV